MLDQHELTVRRQEHQTGILASTFANYSMCRPKTPLKASDFVTPIDGAKTPVKAKRLRKPTAKELAAKVRAIFGPVATPE
jgi:hypothetical protein